MAIRPVYTPIIKGNQFVRSQDVTFDWFPGFSITQKQKSIRALHTAFQSQSNNQRLLDISSKSPDPNGFNLSAFNLNLYINGNGEEDHKMCIESAFQGSKVFLNGGPYQDIYFRTAREAKKDQRIKSSGKLIGFKFFESEWRLEPKTLFYDWLYLNALSRMPKLRDRVLEYTAFTDIEFNPQKSINCQAYSAALFVSLTKRGLIKEALSSRENYIKIVTTPITNKVKPKISCSYEEQLLPIDFSTK